MITSSYDALQRMTGAFESPGTAATYRYDPVGNRLAQTVNGTTTASTYDDANQLRTVGGRTYQYDLNGQVTNDGIRQFTFDARDHLVKWTQGSAAQTFTYNGDDVLTAQTADGIQTQYTQDVAAALPQVLQSRRGGTTTNHLYGLGRIASVTSSTPTWNLTDQRGTGRLTLDSTGTAQGSFRTNAFGQPQDGTQPAPFGFTGELQDSASGLTYLRARWYDPATGRFLSRDPVAGFAGQPSSFNPYQYAYHSPQRFTDPSGNCVGFLGGADTLFCAALIGAGINVGINYGYQVFQNYQHGMIGWDAWTNVCTQELLIAAMSGAVGGIVGWAFAPLAVSSLAPSIVLGMAEGSLTNGLTYGLTNVLLDRRVTPSGMLQSMIGGALGGGVGGGLGWASKRFIDILTFRGLSPRNWNGLVEGNALVATGDIIVDDLAMYGHTGISFDGGKKIFRFRPSNEAMEMPDIDDIIRLGGEVPGQVFDDTAAFLNAHRLSSMGILNGQTQPYRLSVQVSKAEFERLQRNVLEQVADPSLTKPPYRFPVRDLNGNPLPLPLECDNCTTWANRVLGEPVPEYTGQLRDFIPEFIRRGASLWTP